jgi:hypothetical protein
MTTTPRRPNSPLSQRVAAVISRARVRRWEYRQRNLAHGAWYRFRRALAFAELGFAVSEEDAQALLAGGAPRDRGGSDLEPPRTVLWIRRNQIASLTNARPLMLRLDAEMLAERFIALVPFGVDPPPPDPDSALPRQGGR